MKYRTQSRTSSTTSTVNAAKEVNMVKWFLIDLNEKEIHGPYERVQANRMARNLRKESPSEIGLEIGTNIVVLEQKQIIDKLLGK